MKVYRITPTTDYSHGCALVAANSEFEAAVLFKNESDYNAYQYEEYKCVCNIVDNLTYNCIEPTIILDTISNE